MPMCEMVAGREHCSHIGQVDVTFPETMVAMPGALDLVFRVGDGNGGYLVRETTLRLVEPSNPV